MYNHIPIVFWIDAVVSSGLLMTVKEGGGVHPVLMQRACLILVEEVSLRHTKSIQVHMSPILTMIVDSLPSFNSLVINRKRYMIFDI